MSAKAMILSSSAALALAVCSGVLYLQLSSEAEKAALAKSDLTRVEGELGDVRETLAALREELDASKRKQANLQDRWAEERKARMAAEAAVATASVSKEAVGEAKKVDEGSEVITSSKSEPVELAEAAGRARELIGKGDLRGLWRLLFDVIEHGEEGYAKGIEIAELFKDDEQATRDLFSLLWSEEELLLGSVMSDAFEHQEAILRFALHLRNNPGIGGLLGSMSDEITDEMGAVLLGMYKGDDPEIHDGYFDLFQENIEKNIEAKNWRRASEPLRNLAHVRSEKSTEYLIDLLGRTPADLHISILRSLTWHRSPMALDAIREYRETATDKRAIKLADAAIRLLD